MPRFSANLGFLWPDRPYLDRIDAAADAGFGAVELHFPYGTDPRAVADKCAERGVTLLGINTDVSPDKDEFGLAAVPGRAAEARDLVDQAFDWASAAGGTSVHVMAGKTDPDQNAAARDALIATLTYAAMRAEDTGLVALLEPLNPEDMPGYFYSRPDEAAQIIRAVGSDRVRLMFDAYHIGKVGDDVIASLNRHLPITGHIQVAAVPSRAEPDEGTVDFAKFFAEVDRLGWPGWIGAEYRPRDTVEAGLGWMTALTGR